MATIYKEFSVNAPPDFVWTAIKDVGAVHTRLARGFVTDTVLRDSIRTVTRLRRVARDGRYGPGAPATRASDDGMDPDLVSGSVTHCVLPDIH